MESEASVAIGLENFCDGIDVSGRSKVQSQIVGDGRAHDGPRGPLHRVVEAGVNDILLRCTRHSTVEFGRRGHRDSASDSAETPFQTVLH